MRYPLTFPQCLYTIWYELLQADSRVISRSSCSRLSKQMGEITSAVNDLCRLSVEPRLTDFGNKENKNSFCFRLSFLTNNLLTISKDKKKAEVCLNTKMSVNKSPLVERVCRITLLVIGKQSWLTALIKMIKTSSTQEDNVRVGMGLCMSKAKASNRMRVSETLLIISLPVRIKE